eukprot:363812_1
MSEQKKIDREQFLKENKLGDVIDVFIKRDIEIEELLEFDKSDLKLCAKELGLDILAQNRLVKAISKLKSSSTLSNQSTTPVIVTNKLNEDTTDTKQCQQDNIIQCPSMKRLEIILHKFDKYLQNNISNECKDKIEQLIRETFSDNTNYTQLVNDFNHIKYYHHADDNHLVFAEIFQYFTQNVAMNCD